MIKRIREIYSNSKFSRNTAPKVLSLVFAVVFWIFVIDNVNPEMTKVIENVPVELVGVSQIEAEGYIIMGERDFTVDMTVKGRRNDVLKMNKSDLQVTADIREFTNGYQEVPLKFQIDIADVNLINQSRESVLLQIDAIVRKPISVHIAKSGDLPEGYVENGTNLSVEEIFVSGPESSVDKIDRMFGQVILTNMTEPFDRDPAVVPVDSLGEVVTGVDVETNYVRVSIDVLKRSDIEVNPKYTGSVAEGYQLTGVRVIPERISVKGHRDEINNLRFVESESIDLTGVTESFSVEVPVTIPEDMYLDNDNQKVYLSFDVEKVVTKEFVFDYSDITFINKADRYKTNIESLEGQVILKVSAVESLINNLTQNDMGLFIDAESFRPGEMTLSILLNRSNEFNRVEITPAVIDLDIIDVSGEEGSSNVD